MERSDMATVGLPFIKMSASPARQSRQKTKRTAKTSAILMEACSERFSQSETLDRTRSHLNEYAAPEGVRAASGVDVLRWYDEQALKYTLGEVEAGRRKPRKDLVIAYGVIFKPPKDMADRMTADERRRFFADSIDAFNEVMCADGRNAPLRTWQIHNDEGVPHMHAQGIPLNADGRYDAKHVLNAKTFGAWNRDWPEKMRARGWADVENMAVYDPEASDKEAERQRAKAERARKHKPGMSVNQYRRERELDERDAKTEQLGKLDETISQKDAELERKGASLKKTNDQVDAAEKRLKGVLTSVGQKQGELVGLGNEIARKRQEEDEERAKREKKAKREAAEAVARAKEAIDEYRKNHRIEPDGAQLAKMGADAWDVKQGRKPGSMWSSLMKTGRQVDDSRAAYEKIVAGFERDIAEPPSDQSKDTFPSFG